MTYSFQIERLEEVAAPTKIGYAIGYVVGAVSGWYLSR